MLILNSVLIEIIAYTNLCFRA